MCRNIYERAMNTDLLTLTETAFVASVSVRDVNRVIDENILPEGFYTTGNGRHVRLVACPLVGFYFRSAKALTSEERVSLIRRFSERIAGGISTAEWRAADWTIRDGFLTVSLSDFVAEADDRATRLAKAQALIVEDPEILSGTPVLRGTRIPVHDVVASLNAGVARDRILSAYAGLDEETLDLAALYAEATPVRGRPRRFAVLPSDAAVISGRTVPRRRRA